MNGTFRTALHHKVGQKTFLMTFKNLRIKNFDS